MSINFEALDLRAFVAVVDLEGFHRAAEALNLSQPALSRRIQRLEAAVGAALLERTTRRVALTTVGREFLPLVRRMLDEFDSSLFAMRDVGRQRRRPDLARLRPDGGVLLPAVRDRAVQRAVPEHPLQDPRPVRERGPGERGARRGRVRHQPSRARPIPS